MIPRITKIPSKIYKSIYCESGKSTPRAAIIDGSKVSIVVTARYGKSPVRESRPREDHNQTSIVDDGKDE